MLNEGFQVYPHHVKKALHDGAAVEQILRARRRRERTLGSKMVHLDYLSKKSDGNGVPFSCLSMIACTLSPCFSQNHC